MMDALGQTETTSQNLQQDGPIDLTSGSQSADGDVVVVGQFIDLTVETLNDHKKTDSGWPPGYVMLIMFHKLILQSDRLKPVHLNNEGQPISIVQSVALLEEAHKYLSWVRRQQSSQTEANSNASNSIDHDKKVICEKLLQHFLALLKDLQKRGLFGKKMKIQPLLPSLPWCLSEMKKALVQRSRRLVDGQSPDVPDTDRYSPISAVSHTGTSSDAICIDSDTDSESGEPQEITSERWQSHVETQELEASSNDEISGNKSSKTPHVRPSANSVEHSSSSSVQPTINFSVETSMSPSLSITESPNIQGASALSAVDSHISSNVTEDGNNGSRLINEQQSKLSSSAVTADKDILSSEKTRPSHPNPEQRQSVDAKSVPENLCQLRIRLVPFEIELMEYRRKRKAIKKGAQGNQDSSSDLDLLPSHSAEETLKAKQKKLEVQGPKSKKTKTAGTVIPKNYCYMCGKIYSVSVQVHAKIHLNIPGLTCKTCNQQFPCGMSSFKQVTLHNKKHEILSRRSAKKGKTCTQTSVASVASPGEGEASVQTAANKDDATPACESGTLNQTAVAAETVASQDEEFCETSRKEGVNLPETSSSISQQVHIRSGTSQQLPTAQETRASSPSYRKLAPKPHEHSIYSNANCVSSGATNLPQVPPVVVHANSPTSRHLTRNSGISSQSNTSSRGPSWSSSGKKAPQPPPVLPGSSARNSSTKSAAKNTKKTKAHTASASSDASQFIKEEKMEELYSLLADITQSNKEAEG